MTFSCLVALTGSGATVPPELEVVRRLVEYGHRVTVLAEESMAEQVASTGARLRPRAGFGYARDTADEIDSQRPDLVLASYFAFGAMVAAQACEVPFSVLIPGAYPLPAEGAPPPGTGFAAAHGPLGRLRDRVVGTMVQRRWDEELLPQLNALRADFGLDRLAHYQDQVRLARRQLVLSSAAFDFPAEYPEGVRHVGAVLDDPSWAADIAWTPPEGAEPLVLVCLPGTDRTRTDCLRRVVEALAQSPVRAIVTAGPAASSVTPISPRITVLPAAPHRDVMRYASLVVTHGGHGTLMKSFAAELPVLVLPHDRDTADNAARVRVHGAGIALPGTVSPRRMARSLRHVLGTPAYYRAAAELGRAVRRDALGHALRHELEPTAGPPGSAANPVLSTRFTRS